MSVANIRNIAVVGHGSSGKTSLVDALLVKSGALKGTPSVGDGTSFCDFDPEEKKHKHSIESKVCNFEFGGKRFNVLDTPGYPDLIGQTIGALRAADTALICIDAHAGIKVNTRRAWKEAHAAGIGCILCITKVDDTGFDFSRLLANIRETFGPSCVLFDEPDDVGANLHAVVNALHPHAGDHGVIDLAKAHSETVETIIEIDDAAMEKYFEGEEPDDDTLDHLAVEAMKQGHVTPIVCVSAKHDIGVTELLDMLAKEAFSPEDVVRKAMREGDEVTLKPDPAAPLVAQVFRTRIDPFVQKISYVRIFSGTLKKDSMVTSPDAKKGIKIGLLNRVQCDKLTPIDSAGPGEIVAIAKCEDLHTGTSLGDVKLPPLEFPTAMISLAVTPKNRGDEAKLSTSLHKIVEEDPTIHVEHDPETKETVITGMSELHLQLVRERLARRDHVEVDAHEPKIPYRETITQPAEGSYRHKKQTGGSGQFAEVHIRMYPFPEGVTPEEFTTKERFPSLKDFHYHPAHHFLWVDSVVGGSIPGNFMPAIEKGFLQRLATGVIAGCKVQNVCVEVHFGKDHPVDSNENAFRTAGARVFAEVFKQAKPALMEPIVNLHITAPQENVGDISSDLPSRRAQMVGMDQAGGGLTTIEAKAPLSEVMTYGRALSSLTGGQGSFSMELSHYEPVPGNVQQDVIAKAKMKDEED